MDSLNPRFKAKKKQKFDFDYFINGIENQDRYVLGQLITLLESNDEIKRKQGLDVLSNCKVKQATHRISITGSPGVGKSTFINAYANYLTGLGKKVAVLAIDPSSQPTKGSILGDKTRMVDLTQNEQVYVRPSPAGELLGGIAKGTKEAITACEIFGFDYILLETVGVGQSEHLATQIVDFTILLLQIGAGDDIQGIKRGIMEMADLFVVNKDDGDHKELVRKSLSYYRQALTFVGKRYDVKYKRVLSCSSLESKGFDQINDSIKAVFSFLRKDGLIYEQRGIQERKWLKLMTKEYILNRVENLPEVRNLLDSFNHENEETALNYFESIRKKIDQIVEK